MTEPHYHTFEDTGLGYRQCTWPGCGLAAAPTMPAVRIAEALERSGPRRVPPTWAITVEFVEDERDRQELTVDGVYLSDAIENALDQLHLIHEESGEFHITATAKG